MRTSFLLSLTALLATAIHACPAGECDHPGDFTGNIILWPDFLAGLFGNTSCGTPKYGTEYVSIPLSYFDPGDESPCDEPINITNVDTGDMIVALVGGPCFNCLGNDIQVTPGALYDLSALHGGAPTAVNWTFQG